MPALRGLGKSGNPRSRLPKARTGSNPLARLLGLEASLAGLPVAAWLLVLLGSGQHWWTRKEHLASHPLRRDILEVVARNPGTNISELCARLGSRWGTVQHHLRLLVSAGLVQTVMQGRSRCLFRGQTPADQNYRIALLRRKRLLELVKAVVREPGRIQRELARELGMTRKVLRRSVDLLVQAGLIREARLPRVRKYYPTPLLGDLVGANQRALPSTQLDRSGAERGPSDPPGRR